MLLTDVQMWAIPLNNMSHSYTLPPFVQTAHEVKLHVGQGWSSFTAACMCSVSPLKKQRISNKVKKVIKWKGCSKVTCSCSKGPVLQSGSCTCQELPRSGPQLKKPSSNNSFYLFKPPSDFFDKGPLLFFSSFRLRKFNAMHDFMSARQSNKTSKQAAVFLLRLR